MKAVMKKYFILLPLLLFCLPELYAHQIGDELASTMSTATPAQEKNTALTDLNLKNIAGKEHTAKAWQGFDEFLTQAIVVTAAVGGIAYAIPTGTKELKIPCLFSYRITYAPDGKMKLENNTLTIVKPTIVTPCLTIAGLATIIKLGVKAKRAIDHNKNIINFIIADMWN